jgi:hypothetical protein
MRIITYQGRPVVRIASLPSGRIHLKLYERLPSGQPRCLRITAAQWERGRQEMFFNGTVSRSVLCRQMAAERLARLQAG